LQTTFSRGGGGGGRDAPRKTADEQNRRAVVHRGDNKNRIYSDPREWKKIAKIYAGDRLVRAVFL